MDAAEWDARYAGSQLVWSAGPNEAVARECADLTPGRAVDLACGEGRNAVWLAERGWTVRAVDFSAVALDKGRRLAEERAPDVAGRITWEQADATTWQGSEQDLAVLAYLQLAAEDRRAAVRAAWAALAAAGTLLLVAHDSTNLAEGVGGPQDAAVLMSAEDVLADLEAAPGGPPRVRRAERVPREVEAGTAWDCLVRLERP